MSKGQGSRVKGQNETADILVGMKAICEFIGYSEATIIKWRKEYDDFPVKKNGQLISSKTALNEWSRSLFSR
jgi:hypothetical protein